ncbi:cytochrome P450 4C1-like isoform X2 [Chrysoperla carnea]|uniref:cytochrome P450 4C1-like isoform X2 n=1 Tax=Chrysoperla carnea TaxID=189513 RepID=UPI001D066DE7|nr:cytochrome P450 4C1-like isoform X2 [Chrysoperla carnea]
MFLALLMNCLESPIIAVVLLLITVIVFRVRSFLWNYIRMCYYASKLPGPPAYPIIGNGALFLGTIEETTKNLLSLGEQYRNSSLVRAWIGPLPIFAALDPKIVQEVLTNPNALEKPYLMKFIWNNVMEKSILTSEVPEWKHNRSFIIKAFSPVIIKSYFKIFVEKTNILTKKLDLELNKNKSFDIFEYLSRTTLDSVCESTMGVNMNSYNESYYLDAIESALSLAFVRIFNVFKHPNIFYKFTRDYKTISKNRSIIQKFVGKIIDDKRKNYVTSVDNLDDVRAINKNLYKKSFLEYLMDFTKNNTNFTDEQLRNETNTIIFGGFDTTATSLSFVLLQLAGHKDIQTQVYQEILEVLGENNKDSIDFDDLPKLKYMEMVIKESMRLIATGPIIAREVSQDIKTGNNIIPKGATVAIPIFAIHRNYKYWKNPLKFDPERFTPENIKNQHPYAFIPFSAGPRNCIGIRYAWILMKATLATLLSRYEFHTDLNLEELRYDLQVTLKLVNGCQVRITPR